MSPKVVPLSLRNAPALIERLLPVQKLSAEAYKEQMAVHGKTLTALGGYWKGRKPLILNKACILGCLLPATDNPARDLEVFELLMGMDDASFAVRWPRRPKPKDVLAAVTLARVEEYFEVSPPGALPRSAPVQREDPAWDEVLDVKWRSDVSKHERRRLEARALPRGTYRAWVDKAQRPEEVIDSVHDHIWDDVNRHLGTEATSLPELMEQLGVMRFGHRPRVGDTFSGSGQIPFEAARLGCDVYASDLNPMACMLTWGALKIVGAPPSDRAALIAEQEALVERVTSRIDELGIETDGDGWRAKVFLYCVEAKCPQSGWMVPLLPSRVISKSHRAIAVLIPDGDRRRYEVQVRTGVTDAELKDAELGTIRRDSKYDEAFIVHEVQGATFKTKISTLRGDYQQPDGSVGNRLRVWEKSDFQPRLDDLLQERLYAIQWMRPKKKGSGFEYQFRAVTEADRRREDAVAAYVANHLRDWQQRGVVSDLRIEVGGPPRYQGLDLVRSRGWTHWHHLFTPRQLLLAAFVNEESSAGLKFGFTQVLNSNSKLCRWAPGDGGGGAVKQTFYNQALNTLYSFGCRASQYALDLADVTYKDFPLPEGVEVVVASHPASDLSVGADVFVTDPPYGDAVKYEEILDFFIGWLRRNPPPEFANWTWDSRRSLAIKGEDEDFRREMVAAYKRMAECMPDNGLQVVMFTHQSGSLWADMANIVWASGLQVTAAWYVVTETDSALRDGSFVKGTVLLVLRKRQGRHKTTRDDLAWEIQEEVEEQVAGLTGLNQEARGLYRDENVFEDADLQMAGYAAALRVLTRYAVIDGRDMTVEAIRPRVRGETTFVDGLIEFAVNTANQCLVPQGVTKGLWDRLTAAERFYLKMIDLEARGASTLDNYQNFAKAFKVRDFRTFMADQRANQARLRSAEEFGRAEMSEGSELFGSVLRAVLYALMELQADVDSGEVLTHLTFNVPDYYGDMTQRERVVELADYLAQRLDGPRPPEASAARVLRELVRNQRLG